MTGDEKIELLGDHFAGEREVADHGQALPGGDVIDRENAEAATKLKCCREDGGGLSPGHQLFSAASAHRQLHISRGTLDPRRRFASTPDPKCRLIRADPAG